MAKAPILEDQANFKVVTAESSVVAAPSNYPTGGVIVTVPSSSGAANSSPKSARIQLPSTISISVCGIKQAFGFKVSDCFLTHTLFTNRLKHLDWTLLFPKSNLSASADPTGLPFAKRSKPRHNLHRQTLPRCALSLLLSLSLPLRTKQRWRHHSKRSSFPRRLPWNHPKPDTSKDL